MVKFPTNCHTKDVHVFLLREIEVNDTINLQVDGIITFLISSPPPKAQPKYHLAESGVIKSQRRTDSWTDYRVIFIKFLTNTIINKVNWLKYAQINSVKKIAK
jgi:hypothetical protein